MILPPFEDARQFLGPNAMSYSEVSTLSACEKKWQLSYDTPDREKYESSDAMALGSEMHAKLGQYYMGEDYTEEFVNPTSLWLMDRYAQHYADQKLSFEAIEVPFAQKYWGTYIFGWMDGLVRDENGDLWIAEFKTMGNWTKLNQLPVDKQVTLYIWAARAAGYPVKGVMYDAIRTYRWTGKNADDHEPAESFKRVWVTRTDEQIIECLLEIDSTISVKRDLRWMIREPIRNVGQNCDWCGVMPQCYGIELELTDDAEDVTLNF